MRTYAARAVLAVGLFALMTVTSLADEFLEGLQPNQSIHGFKTMNLYDNGSGAAMGARFISEKHGFIVDLLQIQSVPQAFYWIKSPVTGSRGEPHACEHLLLGKGNRGRYVAALEDMALGNSTAYTAQYRTCYHFNTTAGEDTFYEIAEAKLQALLHPDFTDEEIQREVCHIGVVTNEDGTLAIDEKGTVYTEMVSSFERPYYHTYRPLFQLVYGKDHPLTHTSGGDPDIMRSMTPQDMWDFHGATHYLANMGAIFSIPSDVDISSFLAQMSEILDRCEENPGSNPLVGIGAYDFPPPNPAPQGTRLMVNYPSDRVEDPGYLIYSWPADLELDFKETVMLELFLETFGSGETSDLYNLFVNSDTRTIDIGANAVDGWIEDELGHPICFDITGVTSSLVNEALVDSVQGMIVNAIGSIRNYEDGSAELEAFNDRVKNRLVEWRKATENHLNQPPMFGFRRGSAGAWLSKMENLEDVPGFRKALTLKIQFDYADSVLNVNKNVWRERLDAWHLLTTEAYAVGATPSPDIIKNNEAAKEARLAAYVSGFKEKYGVDDDQEAIARYKADFDAKTAELEATYADIEMPGFIKNPPMTLDDQLDYQTILVDENIPLVASTFDNMTSSRLGLALRLDVIPESLMVYVPFLPSALTDVGVIKDGEVVPYDQMQERLRQEVLNFNASFSYGLDHGRVELVMRGEGSTLEELQNSLDWMDAALFASYLSIENLPRIQDRIDQLIQGSRNQMRRSEESWVQSPTNGYRYQDNPLIMSSICFLTSGHHLQRLRWMLTDPGDKTDQAVLSNLCDQLQTGSKMDREGIIDMLAGFEAYLAGDEVELPAEQMAVVKPLPASTRTTVSKLVSSLKSTLNDIPDENLMTDWLYLCRQSKADLLKKPETTLAELKGIINLVSHADNARLFMISNSTDREATLDRIEQFVAKLSDAPSARLTYAPVKRVNQRLASRHANLERPLYAGLVHQGTQNGVLLFRARMAEEYDTSTTAILNCLSGKLYGGGGPHGLFMRTWAAGLAYSNGYGFRQGSGNISYYAERCPDVAETMKFVARTMSEAEPEPQLLDYAIAQIFGNSRAPSRYEQRGEAIAANLADGITPEKVRAYRQKVLQLRQQDNLFEELKARMATSYGPVMIGYGAPLSESREGSFFLIGPEHQFESLEKYIKATEGEQTVYRLYPRDFWLTI